MSFGSDPPPPPDPAKVAAAQTASNKETAIANANLNRVDQTNPFGTSTWKVVGTNPDGTPKWANSTTFSEPLQQNFNTYFGLNNALGQSAQGQLGRVQDMLAKPFDLNTETENKIVELQRARLDPELQRQDESLRTKLTSQGIREGTEAWDRAMERQGRMATDARNQMWLTARAQGANEAMTQRQYPLQEFNSLFRGQQPNNPQFGAIPGVNMANTDVAGITQAGYNNQLQAWNMQNQQQNGLMGDIFGLGGTLGSAALKSAPFMAMFSDIRLKRDIVRVGSLPSGLPTYEWTYVWGGPRVRGVMAHEARELFPDAVKEIGGYLAVDYARIG